MGDNYKPMLCSNDRTLSIHNEQDLRDLQYPLYGSFKFDGLRAIITPMGPRTRALKPIANLHVRKLLNKLPAGLDGEIICRNAKGEIDFRLSQSLCRKFEGEPTFEYAVFDTMKYENHTFLQRQAYLRSILENAPPWVERVGQFECPDQFAVIQLYHMAIDRKYEGIVLRHPLGKYKHGRSSFKEHGMLRFKPLETAEAVVIAVEEEMENLNEQRTNQLGYSHRSSRMEGKFGKGTMGSLVVRAAKWKKTFRVGTGFNAAQRREFFLRKPIGATITFEYDPTGGYDCPRSPRFKGLRYAEDLVP